MQGYFIYFTALRVYRYVAYLFTQRVMFVFGKRPLHQLYAFSVSMQCVLTFFQFPSGNHPGVYFSYLGDPLWVADTAIYSILHALSTLT